MPKNGERVPKVGERVPEVGDHYRPRAGGDAGPESDGNRGADEPYEPGVYRVVGATDGVALLRITDARGRRVHTGELRHVSADALDAEFEPVENPDAGLSPVADLRNALSGLYWQFRKFL